LEPTAQVIGPVKKFDSQVKSSTPALHDSQGMESLTKLKEGQQLRINFFKQVD
jgi:hypothetical protein